MGRCLDIVYKYEHIHKCIYNVMLSLDICTRAHTFEGPILCLYIMKLKNMNVYTITNVLFKFGSLEIVCACRNDIQKLFKLPALN